MSDPATELVIRNAEQVNTPLGRFLAPRGDLVTDHLRDFGSHAGPFLSLAEAVIGPGDLVVDVGGHIGSFTIPLARRVGPTGRVLVLEPNQATRQYLQINVTLNDVDGIVDILPCAAGAEPKDMGLEFRRANTGAARLAEDADDVVVRVVRLDDVVDGDPAFIKIDAEGYEIEVLNGARSTLERCRPSLLIEIDEGQLARFGGAPEDVQRLLVDLDYSFLSHRGDRNTERRDLDLVPIPSFEAPGSLTDVLAVQPAVLERLRLDPGWSTS